MNGENMAEDTERRILDSMVKSQKQRIGQLRDQSALGSNPLDSRPLESAMKFLRTDREHLIKRRAELLNMTDGELLVQQRTQLNNLIESVTGSIQDAVMSMMESGANRDDIIDLVMECADDGIRRADFVQQVKTENS